MFDRKHARNGQEIVRFLNKHMGYQKQTYLWKLQYYSSGNKVVLSDMTHFTRQIRSMYSNGAKTTLE